MIFAESAVLTQPFGAALGAVKEALAEQGFGTLTEIDLQATLKDKIGKDMEPYVIVGACNPRLASRAVDIEPSIGALLPCNVVVRQVGDEVLVQPMDPGLMASVTERDELGPIAEEAGELIAAAMQTLRGTAQDD